MKRKPKPRIPALRIKDKWQLWVFTRSEWRFFCEWSKRKYVKMISKNWISQGYRVKIVRVSRTVER